MNQSAIAANSPYLKEEDEFVTRTISGEILNELLDRPEPPSPLPGILDSIPSLHLLVGAPKCGKTTFCATLAVAAAAGIGPWPTAKPLPQGRVLFLSAEQSAQRLLVTLARIGGMLGVEPSEWIDRMGIVARDQILPEGGRPLLQLDPDEGVPALRSLLEAANRCDEPVRFVFLDSLSRLAPGGFDENSNSFVSEWLGALAALADSSSVYFVALHHTGHSGHRRDPVRAPRGATAYSAIAQVVMTLDRNDEQHPRRRRLRVIGNAVQETTMAFEVAGPARPTSCVDYFRPVLQGIGAELVAAMPVGTEFPSVNAVARAVLRLRHPESTDRPSGGLRREAEQELEASATRGEIEKRGDGWVRVRETVPGQLAALHETGDAF